MRSRFVIYTLLCLALLGAALVAFGQTRDYFTDEEIELVRDAQDIDLRIMVLTHAVERRMKVLKIDLAGSSVKEPEKWGPLPTGSKLELLMDIKRILQKAVDDIDDTASHAGTKLEREIENPSRSKKDKGEKPFHRAVRLLAEAASKYEPLLKAQIESTKDPKETGTLLASIDLCDQIITAAAKPY